MKKRGKQMDVLNKVNNNMTFHLIDGSVIASIYELAEAFHEMSDDSYYYHVGNSKNDFSNWVREVFSEPKLATELEQLTDRVQSQVCVLRYLVKKLKLK